MRTYYIYIVSNSSRNLYIGVTNSIVHRLQLHGEGKVATTSSFSSVRLVYLEQTHDVRAAIAREKELKGWVRRRKIALIETQNPAWDDLSLVWGLRTA